MVRAGETAVERLDLARRRRTVVADFAVVPGFRGFESIPGLPSGVAPPRAALLAGLGDGSIAVSDRTSLWRILTGGAIQRLPQEAGGVDALAPLAGGEFAALSGDRPVIVGPGARAAPPALLRRRRPGPDERRPAGHHHPAPWPVCAHGHRSPGHRLPWRRPERFIDGATLRPHQVVPGGLARGGTRRQPDLPQRCPTWRHHPRGQRAAPRGAVRRTEQLFDHGSLAYRAGSSGHIGLELRYGGRVIATAGATTAGGEGQLTFPVFDAPGLYLLRLRLSTAHGVAEDRLWIDRRHDLSDRDGKAAIVAAYVRTVGDRTAGHEIRTSGCGHYAYNVVDCLLLRSDYRGDLYSGGDRYWRTLRPFGFGDASRPVGDAVRTTLQRIRLTPPPAKLDLPASERPGAQLAVTAHFTLGPSWEEGSPQQSNVLACVAIGHARTGGRIRFAKPLGSTWFGRAWNVVMPVPRRYAATLRHWLDGPRHIFALVTATATSGGFEPPTTVQVMRSTRLTP